MLVERSCVDRDNKDSKYPPPLYVSAFHPSSQHDITLSIFTYNPAKPILFALLIGIDDFQNKSIPPLRGAVADAKDMAMFLAERYDLRARTLHNQEATREAIIAAFHDLKSDFRISPFDPILIYYAGHGNHFPEPDGWKWYAEGGSIQTIIPYDTITMDCNEIHNVISDRALDDLLESLAESKGSNITVILDCCHSNSGTRAIESQFVSRCARLCGTLPPDQDSDILKSTSAIHIAQLSVDSTYPEFGSHILLAACGHEENAYEIRGRGCFTKALTDTLKDMAFGSVTCTELLNLLQDIPPDQNPHFQGKFPERFLFSDKKLDEFTFPVIKRENNELVLLAGTVQAVAAHFVFEVSTIDGEILGRFKPTGIAQEKVILHPESGSIDTSNTIIPEFPKRARARLVEATLPDEDRFKVHFSRSFTDQFVKSVEAATMRRIKMIDTDTAADILVFIEGGEVAFTIYLRPLKHKERLRRTTREDVTSISDVLLKAANFCWHLCREGQEESDVLTEFYHVEERREQSDSGFRPIRRPVEPIKNLIIDGTIDITVDPVQNNYGMKLKNNTDLDFYPYIYYADVRSLKFDDLYDISSTGLQKVDAPLPRRSEFVIGYGTTTRKKLSFQNSSPLPMQYGFIKIFLTTSPLSTSPIAMSPFATSTLRGQVIQNGYWYTCLIKTAEKYP
ncbi:caspase domain-containing protein [Hysterangium stoloniferum]|nr:caspase domain-containing protein [Hysterangium stoloniferum]